MDLVFRDVRIVDGTGAPAWVGDVAVEDGRIAAVGDVGAAGGGASKTIDGGGRLVLAPGFVDTHTHDDGALLAHPGLEFKVAQGCTSLVIGNCGFSAVPFGGPALWARTDATWDGLDGLRDLLATRPPAANAVALVGHNTVRAVAMGEDAREPTSAELDRMRGEVARAMEDGACGFSTGLIYRPGRYATTDEIVELARVAGAHGGVYATHMRNEADRLLEAVDEALHIGRSAGCAVHISHHKAARRRNWGRCRDSLAKVDEANAAGQDVTLDVYPYTAGSGPMVQYVDLDRVDVEWAENTRIASCPAFPAYEGRALVDVAKDEGIALDELVRRILTAPKGDRTVSITGGMSEEDVETNLRHPRVMVGSDGIPDLKGVPHPRLYGTMPRVLGEYVRARGVLALEEAVRRMTSLSCERFGLAERGRVAEGWWADLVLFDAETIVDTATYDDPKREPVGVACVVVNGALVYDAEGGGHTGARPGRLLRYRQ
jgi:N-acyl-D-aspartate/D-glutamate deacylase